MNREIKFRALRKDGEGWACGDLVSVLDAETGNRYPHIVISYNNDTFDWIEVIPETVGQFTGLKDKNGVDIYEGDLFTADFYPFKDDGAPNYNGVIEWIFAGFQYVLTCVNSDKRGVSDGINEVLEDGGWIEVIGNIHEKEVTNG